MLRIRELISDNYYSGPTSIKIPVFYSAHWLISFVTV